METSELLKIYRDQIDTLDKEVLYLFSRRFELVKQIGITKKENNIEILQNNRWEELLNDNIEVGKELLLNEKFIRDIWDRIHEQSLKIEEVG